MNYKRISSLIGVLLLVESILMVIPAIVALIYKDNTLLSFAVTIAALAVAGILCIKIKPDKGTIYAREGYVIVGLSWILMSLFGALPFFISGYVPNFIDAFFETVSGFTTTGSTVISNVEALPKSLLFWRSFTHWIGGMGILVFVIAIIPKTEGNTMHIMRAEVPGPTVGKLVSKISASARILYGIYCGMTLIMALLLWCSGMSAFDSLTNAFATAGTGGFSVLNSGISGYNNVKAEMIIAVFMLLFGVNFNIYYLYLKKQWKRALKSEELKWYLGIIGIATALIMIKLFADGEYLFDSFRHAFFQVTSIISTTGFSNTDFEQWAMFSKIILYLLMFVGGMVGSTGGGLKVNRIMIIFKDGLRSLKKSINPRYVSSVKIDDEAVDEDVVHSVTSYISTFFVILGISTLLVSFEGQGFSETISSVVTCAMNVGPGFGSCGATGTFESFSVFSKLVLSLDMLIGRLEIVPILMLFSKGSWTRHSA